MQKKDFFPLRQDEKQNKKAYLADRGTILFSPISFEDYARQASDGNASLDWRQFYQETTRDGKGLTITHNQIYETTDIHMSRHPRYSYPILHNHDFVELIYVLNGNCVNYIEGKAITMHAGDLCFMAPSAVHALLAVSVEDIIINTLLWPESFSHAFSGILRHEDAIGRFFKNLSIPTNERPYMVFRTGGDATLERLMLESYTEFQNKEPFYTEMIGYKINALFVYLSRHYLSKVEIGEAGTEPSTSYIYPIVSFIQMHYKTITLKELAKIFSYSEAYLSKLVKKNTGQSFQEIVEEARFEEAKYLLLNTDYTMTEISQRAGYYDASHMNRNFVKKLGYSPSKWLETMKRVEG